MQTEIHLKTGTLIRFFVISLTHYNLTALTWWFKQIIYVLSTTGRHFNNNKEICFPEMNSLLNSSLRRVKCWLLYSGDSNDLGAFISRHLKKNTKNYTIFANSISATVTYHLNHTFSIYICISDAISYKTKYFLYDLLGGNANLYT